jgi:SagB-type dehydrogenase family enzyme
MSPWPRMQRAKRTALSRRRFVRRLAAAGAVALVGSEWLGACGPSGELLAGSRQERLPNQPNDVATRGTTIASGAAPDETALPPPRTHSDVSVEEALVQRRSIRSYVRDEPLDLNDIAQLFWAAQGMTRDWGARTAPSAGALYPLELYAATSSSVYHYLPAGHQAEATMHQDVREALWAAGLQQQALAQAPVIFVLTAVYRRTAGKYGARAERYVTLEAGHAAENLLLQAVALGLGAVVIGAFYDPEVVAALNLPSDEEPLYLIPVGHPTG